VTTGTTASVGPVATVVTFIGTSTGDDGDKPTTARSGRLGPVVGGIGYPGPETPVEPVPPLGPGPPPELSTMAGGEPDPPLLPPDEPGPPPGPPEGSALTSSCSRRNRQLAERAAVGVDDGRVRLRKENMAQVLEVDRSAPLTRIGSDNYARRPRRQSTGILVSIRVGVETANHATRSPGNRSVKCITPNGSAGELSKQSCATISNRTRWQQPHITLNACDSISDLVMAFVWAAVPAVTRRRAG